jgi:hypothetical protein
MARTYTNRSIRFYPNELRALDAYAKRNGRSLHAIVRQVTLALVSEDELAA